MMIRDYQEADYQACETLVDQAWEFHRHFQPTSLYDYSKYLYTMSSIESSNFKKVVEIEGKVRGFLFAYNEVAPKPQSLWKMLLSQLHLIKTLLLMSGLTLKEKFSYLAMFNEHEANRHKIEERGASEINLFVIEEGFRGRGIGSQLIDSFIQFCKTLKVKRIIVEANLDQASKFYEKQGFCIISSFESPLHSLVAGEDSKALLMERYIY